MRTLRGGALCALTAGISLGQIEPGRHVAGAPLPIVGVSEPSVGPFVRNFVRNAHGAAPPDGMVAATLVLGHLRLGDHAAARAVLRQQGANGGVGSTADASNGCNDPAWLIVALYWYLRASRDAGTAAALWPDLRDGLLRRATMDGATRVKFVHEAMHAHALFCLGGILDTIERIEHPDEPQRPRPGAAWTSRAIDHWLAVERQAWQPGRGHFRPHLTADTIALPEPADGSVLLPAATGFLVATGDRTLRSLRSVLAIGTCTGDADDVHPAIAAATPALELGAAAQLGDPILCAVAWYALLADRDGDAPPRPDVAAWRLDAALFAITGLRLATGVGVDEEWVRVRPWLPPGIDHVHLQGLCAEGVRFDLDVSRRNGALLADERDEHTQPDTAPSPRLRVHVTLVSAATASTRLVLQGPTVQHVCCLQAGEQFARSLPTGQW